MRYAQWLDTDVLAGATGDSVVLDSFTQGAHGTVAIASGLLRYTPTGDTLGADSLTYTLKDAHAQTVTGTVYVSVGLPTAPTAGYGGTGSGTGTAASPFTTAYATPITVPALASSAGYHLAVSATTDGAHGTVAVGGAGDPAYTPAAGWTGLDTFTYTVRDAFGQTATATAYVSTDLPAAPVAPDGNRSVQAPGALAVAAPGVLDSATGTGIAITAHGEPAHGTLSLNSSTGAYTYTPAAGYVGPDSFTYTITDAFARPATGTIHLTVDPPPAPTTVDQDPTTAYQTPLTVDAPGVLAGATGTAISVTGHTDPAHGTASVGADGAYTYTPASGFAGTDSFSATVTDSYGQSATVHVTVTVGAPASPVVPPSSVEVTYETASSVPAPGVLAGATGVGLSITDHTNPAHGTVSITADGAYTYTPDAGYLGPDAFDVTATDAFGRTTTATVSVTVTAATTMTTLTASPVGGATFGRSVELTAVVSAPVGTPSGTVTFLDGTTVLGSATLVDGQATLTTTALSVADHALTAAFTPSGSTHRSSTSDPLAYTVTKATTATAVTSSANPSMLGQSVTFTATVTGPGGTPGGTVTFADGATTLATVALDAGTATWSTSALAPGTHGITATYHPAGGSYLGSTSTAVSQVVTGVNTVTSSISSSFNATAIASGRYLWFAPTAKVRNLDANAAVTIKVTNVTALYGTTTQTLPDEWLTFDPLATRSTATFDAANNRWVVTVPTSVAASGNSVLGGYAVRTTAAIAGGLTPVKVTATFSTVNPGIDIDWRWGAAVYTSFNTNPALIGLKPVDDKTTSAYANTDPAGTPESFRTYLTPGAKGTGGTSYIGTATATTTVRPS